MNTKNIARAIVVGSTALIFSAAANAATLNLAAGTLQTGTTNNEFLLEFGLNGTGLETPYPAFENNGSGLTIGSQNTSYQQSTNPTFIFDFSFFVAQEATISQNTTYATYVGSATSSVSLFQGSTVVDTGNEVSGDNYVLPSVTLQPNTQYDLVVTTLGVPPYTGSPETRGWGQIAVDVAAVPEPSLLPLLGAGGLLLVRRRKRA